MVQMPRSFTRLLAHMRMPAGIATRLSLLFVGGEDGIRFRAACAVIAGGTGIRAKTGSLSRALALPGYADSKTRGRLAFLILVNDFSAPPKRSGGAWIDKIAMSLLE